MSENINALRRYRDSEGLSLDRMATSLGVNKGHLSRVERGLAWPSREFFERLAQVTGGRVTVADFVAPTAGEDDEAAQ